MKVGVWRGNEAYKQHHHLTLIKCQLSHFNPIYTFWGGDEFGDKFPFWGRVVRGRVVPGTSCPGDELSPGRVVQGTSCPGTSCPGTSCPGTSCPSIVFLPLHWTQP